MLLKSLISYARNSLLRRPRNLNRNNMKYDIVSCGTIIMLSNFQQCEM